VVQLKIGNGFVAIENDVPSSLVESRGSGDRNGGPSRTPFGEGDVGGNYFRGPMGGRRKKPKAEVGGMGNAESDSQAKRSRVKGQMRVITRRGWEVLESDCGMRRGLP
jgi:hypothetical protein